MKTRRSRSQISQVIDYHLLHLSLHLLALRTDSSPTNVTVDASRAIQTLLQERPDASDMDVDSWARGLGIEEDVAKDYVKQLRVENGTASRSGSSTGAGLVEGLEVTTRTMDASNDAGTPPHTLSREPGSPQPEISTVVPQHLDTSPFIMSPGSVPYALNPKAISPFTGPFRQPVPDQESPAVSCSPVLASPSDDSTGHLHDNDTIISRAAYSHPSPSGSTHADGFDSRCRRSASPTFTSMHDLSQTGAPLDVPTTRDETPWETPAQMLDHNVGIEDNSHQLNGFTRPAKSATDEAHFAITDNFDDFAPALPILAPDENVPHRPPLSESSEMQDDADARTAADQLNSKFKPFRDAMDALILRIRAARRDQTCRTDDPST
ncbi:hypothetical protein BD410DRAFT_189924 [Rickenella mellea]|uniref:Uncharacterized protein n=1 Tax=Rickenella mellea TaxID=50990 RepID=A0A4Y7Q703_9AGAM|nr:hypothetical protein BD410DRAFT_189924 [Rickenella mellea]